MLYHFYRPFITVVWKIIVGAVFTFLLKYILFHAMKQIANVCYFYYYGYMTPFTLVKVVSVFLWKKPFLFMYLFYSMIALAKQRWISEELMLS